MLSKVGQVVGDFSLSGQAKAGSQPTAEIVLGPAKAKFKVSDLQRRALLRFVQEQGIQQANMEAILSKAIPAIEESGDAESLDEDWIAHFFGRCRTISNEAMRVLWAKVLAGEVNKPGQFSKRTINLLGELDRQDIEGFALLCSFSIYSIASPVILFKSSQIAASYAPTLYIKHGLDQAALRHLDSLGLIHFDTRSEYTKPPGPIRYFGHSLTVNPDGPLKVGNAIFTKAGWELARVVTAREVPEFFELLKRTWRGIIVEGAATSPRK